MRHTPTRKTNWFPTAAALCFGIVMASQAAAAPPAPAAGRDLACAARKGAGDVVDFSCPLVATGAAQRFRLSATFEGSHDDTKLLMKPTLDGATIACDPGSKTSSLYEDGDIVLECRFQTTARAGTNVLLAVRLQWYHAQLAKTVFVSE